MGALDEIIQTRAAGTGQKVRNYLGGWQKGDGYLR